MNRRRVKITGIGFITPAGNGKEAFKRGILESKSYVTAIDRFPPEAGPFVAAEVKDFKLSNYVGDSALRRMPRHTQFALAAANLALQDAGIALEDLRALAPLIVTGTATMDSEVVNKTIENVVRKGPNHALTRVIQDGPVSSVSSTISDFIGGGRTLTLQSACCSGTDAIGQGMTMIAEGECDIAICGGTEAPIFYHPMLELKHAGLSPNTSEMPEKLCRPFDMWRTTGVIGEGAAMLILEPESSRRPGYAFVSGFSFASDPPKKSAEGLYTAIGMCMANAGVRPSTIDMISAWGPGHRLIDAVEARVLKRYFGEDLVNIPVASIKGAIGNPFAAAGAIQAGCAALSIRDSFIPPTVNWHYPDPDCPLNLSCSARFIPVTSILLNSHGISGTNSCLILQR